MYPLDKCPLAPSVRGEPNGGECYIRIRGGTKHPTDTMSICLATFPVDGNVLEDLGGSHGNSERYALCFHSCGWNLTTALQHTANSGTKVRRNSFEVFDGGERCGMKS